MASASSSTSIIPPQPPRSPYTYHVFLCFRGPDTGNGFTSHLHAALRRKGIITYKDDKNLRVGDVISDELVKAIEESMFAVIVFSPDFASSSWCLDEVCKIIDCKNKLLLQMVEVFYHVEPCEVRHQIGTFHEAFLKHKREGRHESEKVQRWRDALKQVTKHSGWTSKNQPDEAALVENIAQHIFELLIPKLPSSMKNLAGIESRMKQVISQIGLGFNDVRYIAIWGLGGIGKTTIARAVFETIRSRFEVSCFVADVRQHFEKQGISGVQKQLLKQMKIISSDADYIDKYDGSITIQTSFHGKKVLIVLDDVSHEDQLESFTEKDWFGPGSRIIITTRNKEVLKQQERHETYNVTGLVESEAFNLFCSKAFKQPEPLEGFWDLSKEVVDYCSGLPLALKVLGSYLKDRPIAIWHSAIQKIKSSSHSDIIDVLKISYDGLDSMEKNIFLDIACFFKGYEKEEVIKILEGCGRNAEIGIDILTNRSLITLEVDEIDLYKRAYLGMHDLLEEMGKQIVVQESPNDASKHSRLWCYKDIDSILNQKKRIGATQSIVLYDKTGWDITSEWRAFSFSNIWQLKLFILDGVKTRGHCNIPCTLKSLNKLEHLNLFNSKKLKQIPDLSGVPNLKTLNLERCRELNYIHSSLVHHKSLVELNLRECNRLETLGDKLEMSSLKKLNLFNCTGLRRLPEFGECMKQLSTLNLFGLFDKRSDARDCSGFLLSHGCLAGLKKLELTGCRPRELSRILFRTHGLVSLSVIGWFESEGIATFFDSLSHLTSLTSLKLNACFHTSEEAEEPTPYYDLSRLALLTDLELVENYYLRVPINIHQLPRLTRLELTDCSKLEVLPELPSSLRELHAQYCDSLDASNVNDAISKACCVFAESAPRDHEDILQMCISGKEIPAWFENQEEDNGVSVSFPRNCPSTDTVALALCFQFEGDDTRDILDVLVICNGNEFINQGSLNMKYAGNGDLGIICMNSYYLSKLLCQHNRFQLITPYNHEVVERCGARWVCKQDIQGFKKKRSKRKRRTTF
ncbi:hypothetical protein PIB30_094375 [Stylosanthes scabra]|uniref:ADP-ribosyl cyclase/cyclic ADP-ribose hydrolase n=1 Tax=Stylosanthes scabra TaxID=79078 RepID=A0ABU6ZU20_9FABA|nr:hypothetical protein [Stylosanthes scabra]